MSKSTTYGQKRGRENGKHEQFMMIFHHVLRHDKYKALSGNAVKALNGICERHDGSNNGEITLSSRDAGELMGFDYRTAARALNELVQRGFLVVTREASFGQKRLARTYAITLFPYQGRQPTYAFKRPGSPEFSVKTCWRPKAAKGKNENIVLFEAPEVLYDENAVSSI